MLEVSDIDEWREDRDNNSVPIATCPACNSNAEQEADTLTRRYRWVCMCGEVSEWS